MTTTVDIVTEACGGSTSPLLIQLTNAAAATSINATVLARAASMCEGKFRLNTGIEPDPTADWHTGALIAGTLYYLLFLKGSDAAQTKERRDEFRFSCLDIRKRATMSPTTSSVLTPRPETVGVRPDLDRDGFVGGLTDGVRPNAGAIVNRSPTDPE